MQTFKLFVVGPFASGKTAFIESISEIGVVSTELRHLSKEDINPERIIALDFGRLTLHDDLVLYLFGHPASRHMTQTFEAMGQKGMPLSDLGFVLVVDSVKAEMDRESVILFQFMQAYNRPLVVALSKQDLPNVRTPQQMREILAIPNDVKVLSYDWKDPKTTKQVLLALVELFPRDELIDRVIEGLKAKIDGD